MKNGWTYLVVGITVLVYIVYKPWLSGLFTTCFPYPRRW